ncbi:MAG: type II toxin-antitoxin system RelE family toxin [Rhodoglobus sp.]
MSYAIRFTPKAAQQVRKIDPASAKRIHGFLEQKLSRLDRPRLLGKKLVDEDFCRYRVGDYRLLTNIDDDQILSSSSSPHTAVRSTPSSRHSDSASCSDCGDGLGVTLGALLLRTLLIL